MRKALLGAMPPGGWTTDDLDRMPVSNIRYELTDGALTVSPSPSNLHQMLLIKLGARMDAEVPEPYTVTGDVEIRFARQLTRIPNLMVMQSEQPAVLADRTRAAAGDDVPPR